MRRWLLPGEQVIVVTRRQPRMLAAPVVVFVLVPALASYGCAWIIKGGPRKLFPLVDPAWNAWFLAACIGLALVIIVGYSFRRFLQWRAVSYVLTNRRVMARFGWLGRRDWQVSLASVHNIGVRQSLLQRILRSGNIFLDTGHGRGSLMTEVPEVARFRNFILDAVDELPEGWTSEAGTGEAPDAESSWMMREGERDER
jgi:membrane protein YdbS with pleckstrin-like domain